MRSFQYRPLAILTLFLLLAGCSSGGAQLEGELITTENRLADLSKALNNSTLRNANIINQYAKILSASKPELAPLLRELSKESTISNPLYKSLESRYLAVKDETEPFDSWADKVEELKVIQAASNLAAFNDALSDTVNVIADLSEGKLARVNAVSKDTEMTMNNSKDHGAGSQYIGNPHYGRWNHGSGGSMWAWYGQYHFFSSMFGGRPYYYNSWAGNRGYSYYHDVGRSSYTSRTDRTRQVATDTRARKQFGSSGNYRSPYSKSRTGATGMSKASLARQKSTFNSPYSKGSSSSTSKYQSSTRSNYRRSTGTSRGK